MSSWYQFAKIFDFTLSAEGACLQQQRKIRVKQWRDDICSSKWDTRHPKQRKTHC